MSEEITLELVVLIKLFVRDLELGKSTKHMIMFNSFAQKSSNLQLKASKSPTRSGLFQRKRRKKHGNKFVLLTMIVQKMNPAMITSIMMTCLGKPGAKVKYVLLGGKTRTVLMSKKLT